MRAPLAVLLGLTRLPHQAFGTLLAQMSHPFVRLKDANMVSELSISPNELLPLLGTDQVPCLIDVCVADDIAAAPWRLPGAVHVSHMQIMDWVQKNQPTRPVVVICQKGLKLSHGAAARLRAAGFDAKVLEGGNQTWFAANHPRVSLTDAPAPKNLWAFPEQAQPRHLGLAWLIRRWFDPEAELIWVPQDLLEDVSERFDAESVPTTLAALCARINLDHPPLSAFIKSIDDETARWMPLLAALRHMHSSHEEQIAHALQIIDAAWTASREDAR